MFFSEKKAPNHPKAPTFSLFYLVLKDFIWGQVQPYVVAASECQLSTYLYIPALLLYHETLPNSHMAPTRPYCKPEKFLLHL